MRALVDDLRFALRSFRRQRGFTALAVLVLALGSGFGTQLWVRLSLQRVLQSQLHGISPTDPATFAVCALTLALVAALASLLPAHRATRVDPLIALYQD